MSTMNENEPACIERDHAPLVIASRPRDLGGFAVRRVLPAAKRRLVGPFIFFDEMGPAEFEVGQGMDVRPHPHIGLSTLTYLFEGEVTHRDSLGTTQVILPGEVNWMTAGHGVVHSERISPEVRARGASLHGIQVWIALPREHEEIDPSFEHHAAGALPRFTHGDDAIEMTLITGHAYGHRSPVSTYSDTFYVAADAPRGGTLRLTSEHEERAIYVVRGEAAWGEDDGMRIGQGEMVVIDGKRDVPIEVTPGSRVMLLGGAHLPGERIMFWNFVSTSAERMERAKADWKSEKFPKVPGDEIERIPLPE